MTVTVNHAKTNAISDWTQAQLDEQIALGNFPAGTTLANIVLPSDWNDDHTLTGLGTMAEQDANSVAITGGTATLSSVTTPSVTATVDNLAINSVGTGTITLSSGNGIAFRALDNGTTGNSWAAYGSTVSPVLEASGSATNVNGIVRTKGTGIIAFRTNTVDEQLRVSHTASAVNYVQVTGAATGGQTTISAQGSDSSITLDITSKNEGNVRLRAAGGNNFEGYYSVATPVNNLGATGSTTGIVPILASRGTDTNISMAFQPKGTGAINLAAGSRGVNISNGGTVTAVTITNNGATAYTSHPTPAITAPTTAGGVQAVATSNMYFNSAIATTSIVNGGTGYTVGNVLTVVGGTFTAAATFTVATVSGGVITGITSTTGGTYSVIPTGTLSVTGGTGTGFTLTINGWAVRSLNITNAGSGYIEQPTITFSGGGGSGASAYATVGSGTIVRGIGSTLEFANPNGVGLRVNSTAISANLTDYVELSGGASGVTNGVYVRAGGSTTNNALYIQSKGTGNISFFTNWVSGAAEQFRVSHTASAVNYVQVTGSATGTGNSPTISAQGSDADVNLTLNQKGNGLIRLQTAGITRFTIDNTGSTTKLGMSASGGAGFQVTATGSQVNSLATTGTVSGSNNVVLSTQGTDTNIDLSLTPKGTGLVRFGTYVAGALTATGYINIKAADGTTYKVLVST
jgi:hypothetical protein